jgi:hypothetical protein
MTIAKIKRGSTPEAAETFVMAALMSAISVGELLAPQPLFAQDCCMMGMLAVNMSSKSIHWDWAGQPAATVPLPVYILYAVEATEVDEEDEPEAEVWVAVVAVEAAGDVAATEDPAADEGVLELELELHVATQ